MLIIFQGFYHKAVKLSSKGIAGPFLKFFLFYKKTAILRIVSFVYGKNCKHDGPLYEAYCLVVNYGLQQQLMDLLHTGCKIDVQQMKRMLWQVVKVKENAEREATLPLYGSLKLFRECIPKIEMCVWWRIIHCRPRLCRATLCIVKLACGQYRSMRKGTAHAHVNSGRCILCDNWDADEVPHLLFVCDYFNDVREALWGSVLREMPLPMQQYVQRLSVKDKTKFIISGLNSDFVMEWLDLYEAVILFLSAMYDKKCSSME